jgi:CheY-like chemotaxis protein
MSIPKILVVDDDNDVCRIVRSMLSHEQYQVQTGQSVADAFRAIEQKPFDAYVLDYKLPDGSGLDIAERIRSKGSEAPIILISCDNTNSVASRAEKIRIFDFLQKPFSREMMCNAVKMAIGSLPVDPPPGALERSKAKPSFFLQAMIRAIGQSIKCGPKLKSEHRKPITEYMVNTMKAKSKTFILPAAVGLIATVITYQVRTPAVEPLPPYSTTIYSSTPANGHFCSSGAAAYYAQAAPTPTPDPTGGGIPLKS